MFRIVAFEDISIWFQIDIPLTRRSEYSGKTFRCKLHPNGHWVELSSGHPLPFFPASLYLKDSKKKTIRVHRIKQYNVLVNIYLDQIYVVLFLLSRPPTSFPWFTSPLKALRHIIWGRYKWYIIGFLIFLLIVSLIAFFIYAAPVSKSYLTDPSSQRAVSVCKSRQAHCCRSWMRQKVSPRRSDP